MRRLHFVQEVETLDFADAVELAEFASKLWVLKPILQFAGFLLHLGWHALHDPKENQGRNERQSSQADEKFSMLAAIDHPHPIEKGDKERGEN